MENRTFSDAGGTPGGLGHFALGFIMVCIGGYLLINQVMVVSSYWGFFGGNSFGITLLPDVIRHRPALLARPQHRLDGF